MKDFSGLSLDNSPSDEDLVAASKNGDQEAFGQLLKKYQPSLFSMVLRQLGHREEAEDVVQQVFLKAFQHINGFRGESKFYTWIYTIALNVIRNHVRQRNSRKTISLDDPGPSEDPLSPQWAEKGPSPEEEVAQQKEIESIRNSLETLGEEQRTIFVLHYFQQLPLAEVAERLGRPLGTVKVYLHRARKAVYKSVSEGKPVKNGKDARASEPMLEGTADA